MSITAITGSRQDLAMSKNTPQKDMSMDEYRQYINGKISQIQGSRSDFGAGLQVSISEDGFRAMKNNPDYENWVFVQLAQADTAGSGVTYISVGADRKDFKCELWLEEKQTKKKLSEKIEEDYQNKQRLRKKQMAKAEHYRQYQRMLMENSIRKADIESAHINGSFDDPQNSSKSLNAIASYRAIMSSTGGEIVNQSGSVKPKAQVKKHAQPDDAAEVKEQENEEIRETASQEQSGKVAVNAEKRSRQINSAKTPSQIRAVIELLRKDIADCKAGLEKGWCDESEVAKAEALMERAKEKQAMMPPEDEIENAAQSDMEFLLNSIM